MFEDKLSEKMRKRLEFLELWLLSLLRQNKSAALTVVWLIIAGDVIFFSLRSDIIIFGLLGLYILCTRFYKLKSKITFSFCFFILAILFFEFIFTGVSDYTEKAAVLLFLFMAIGILQELLKK